jgi:hypothetical protein
LVACAQHPDHRPPAPLVRDEVLLRQTAGSGGSALVPSSVDGGTLAIAEQPAVELADESADELPAPAPVSARTLTPCKKLVAHTVAAKLLALPAGATAFAPRGYLGWGWTPGKPLELLEGRARTVLASHASKPNEPLWFPANVHSAPDGRIVWSVPEGVFVYHDGATRQVADKGSRSGVIVGRGVYYVKDDTVYVDDPRGDRVVLRPKARVNGKEVSSYVLRAGGGALGIEATAEDVKVGPWKWSAKVLGWIDRGKIVDGQILDVPLGVADLHGDTYVFADNASQTELYALQRGKRPVLILSAQMNVEGLGSLQQLYGPQWEGGTVYFETPSGIFRLDECKIAPVAHELLKPSKSPALAADHPERVERVKPERLPEDIPGDDVAKPAAQLGPRTTILHANYGDALSGDRAIVQRVEGTQITSFLYVPREARPAVNVRSSAA